MVLYDRKQGHFFSELASSVRITSNVYSTIMALLAKLVKCEVYRIFITYILVRFLYFYLRNNIKVTRYCILIFHVIKTNEYEYDMNEDFDSMLNR